MSVAQVSAPIRSRARGAQAKLARRESLILAASELLEESEDGEISVARVAQRAGIAKGTVYLYFESKEEIFVELFHRALCEWSEEVVETLPRAGREGPAAAFAKSLAERPYLRRLMLSAHARLRPRLTLRQAAAFDAALSAELDEVAIQLEKVHSVLCTGDGHRLLRRAWSFALGLQAVAGQPGEDGHAHFELELRRALEAWLRGWRAGG